MFKRKPAQAGAAAFAVSDLSFENIRSALQAALGTDPDNDGDEDYPWIVDVFPMKNTFVYSCDGQSYEQGFAIDDQGNVTLVGVPRQVKSVTTYEPVKASFSAEGDDLVYEGEIFRAGNYPDKGVNATQEVLRNLATAVKGLIPAKIQHTSTAFDKALSEYGLEKVEARDNGEWLWGKVRLPKWMESALGKEFAVSVGLTKTGETPTAIDELSIVNTGRVPTARIAAAFAQFAGSRHSASDMSSLQAIHDACMDLGADCGDQEDGAQMAGSRHSKADMADIQAIHDLAVKQGVSCKPSGAQMSAIVHPPTTTGQASPPPKGKPMNLKEKLMALFGKVDPKTLAEAGLTASDLEGAEFSTPATPTVDPTIAAQLAQFQATQEAMATELSRANAALLSTEASRFADSVIADRRALPAQKPTIMALFENAAKADGGGKATFGSDNTVVPGENLKIVKAHFEATPQHSMFSTEIPGKLQTGEITKDRVEELLSHTPLGQKVLASKEGK